jgi:hypothetical protein
MSHAKPSVVITPLSSDCRTLPPSYSGRNRIETVTGARIYNNKDKITMVTDNGTNRIAADTDIANSSIAVGGKSKIPDNSENKEHEISITNDKASKNIENQSTVSNTEKDFNSNHEKGEEPSEDYNESEECECRGQNQNVSSSSPSDVEAQLKKLTIAVPEGGKGEPIAVGTQKCHGVNYSSSMVCSFIHFKMFFNLIFYFLSFICFNIKIIHDAMDFTICFI